MANYKQGDVDNVPVAGDEFRKRFSDNTILTNSAAPSWAKVNNIKPWPRSLEVGEFPALNFNQMSVNDFF